MPNVPCKVAITCPGNDNGLFNSSAEAPDRIRFGATGFPMGPPAFNAFTAQGCLDFCFSEVSQQAADDCAAQQAFLCVVNPPGGGLFPAPTKPKPKPVFFNNLASCIFPCPDGTEFVNTVPQGTFAALNQIESDRIAQQRACDNAASSHICLSDITLAACTGSTYSSTISANGGTTPIIYTITAGALPTGLHPSSGADERSLIISGTPTAAGAFNFTVTARDANGIQVIKDYLITITDLNLGSVPQPVLGQAYSFQIQPSFGVVYSMLSGALPTGLGLSAAGLISGTVTSTGTSTFTIRSQDADGNVCTGTGTMTVQACVDWTKLVWAAPNVGIGANGGTGGASAFGIQGSASGKNGNVAGSSTQIDQMAGTMLYTGGACLCTMLVQVTTLDLTNHVGNGSTQVAGGVEVVQNGGIIAEVRIDTGTIDGNNSFKKDNSGTSGVANGPFTVLLTFTVIAGVNSPISVNGAHNNQFWVEIDNGGGSDQGKLEFNFVIGN